MEARRSGEKIVWCTYRLCMTEKMDGTRPGPRPPLGRERARVSEKG